MAGRRWGQGSPEAAPTGKQRPRPSERAGAGQPTPPAAPEKAAASADKAAPGKKAKARGGTRTIGPDGKPVTPDQISLDAARALINPPKAPWHPLPLAEIGIVLGMIAMLVAVILHNARGAAAGFTLIVLCTAEFSWREHRHGYRPHATILAMTVALFTGMAMWILAGVTRNVAIIVAGATFLVFWGLLDRSYVPARNRVAAESDGDADEGAAAKTKAGNND